MTIYANSSQILLKYFDVWVEILQIWAVIRNESAITKTFLKYSTFNGQK